jgi:hypothetical protein
MESNNKFYKPEYIYTRISKDDWFSVIVDIGHPIEKAKKSKKGIHFRFERWREERLVHETYRMYEADFFNKNGRFFKERLLRRVRDRLTEENLTKYFVFASEKTIRRAITSLVKMKLIGQVKVGASTD